MAFARRDETEHPDRDTGLSAAVGLLSSRQRRHHVAGRTCRHCGAQARVDMIDMARTRAYLTCLSCGNEWDTDRMDVLRSRSSR